MFQFNYKLKVAERVKAKCERHPRFPHECGWIDGKSSLGWNGRRRNTLTSLRSSPYSHSSPCSRFSDSFLGAFRLRGPFQGEFELDSGC